MTMMMFDGYQLLFLTFISTDLHFTYFLNNAHCTVMMMMMMMMNVQ